MQNYILHIDLVYRYFSDFLDFVVENSKSRVSVYNHSIPKLRTPWTAKTYALYDIFRPYPASRHQHPVTHNANLWLGVADVAENAKTDTIRTIRPWIGHLVGDVHVSHPRGGVLTLTDAR